MDGAHGETAESGVCGMQQMRFCNSRATAKMPSPSAYSGTDNLCTLLLYRISLRVRPHTPRATNAGYSLAMTSDRVMAGAGPPQKYVHRASARTPNSVRRRFGVANASMPLARTSPSEEHAR